MDELKLCESDYRFMLVIWDNEPLASRELVKLCAKKLGWKKSTTYTTLKKLCEKGFAQNSDPVVTSLIPREKAQAYESERFVERAFEGSLPQFLVSFLGRKTISEQEAVELKRLMDAQKRVSDGSLVINLHPIICPLFDGQIPTSMQRRVRFRNGIHGRRAALSNLRCR